jgi:hypothetical protein
MSGNDGLPRAAKRHIPKSLYHRARRSHEKPRIAQILSNRDVLDERLRIGAVQNCVLGGVIELCRISLFGRMAAIVPPLMVPRRRAGAPVVSDIALNIHHEEGIMVVSFQCEKRGLIRLCRIVVVRFDRRSTA